MKTEIDCKEFGKALAHSGDDAQAELLNSFALELKVACKNDRNRETQLCYLSDRLDKNGTALIKDIAEFIKLREENKL